MKLSVLCAGMVMCGAICGTSQAAEGYFDSNGVKIRYVTEGAGEAVVLIHGWLSDSTMWGRDRDGNTKLDVSRLPGFKVIALDCRGHGKSDGPHDAGRYGVEMANDVVRLLDHLKIKKAHLVGYSMGVFIAGKVVASHPERVLSAIYGGQAPLYKGAKPSGSREVEAFAKAAESGKGMGAYIIEVTPAGRPKPTPGQAEALANFMLKGKDIRALAAAGLSFDRLEVAPKELARRIPTLFIYGSKEPEYVKERVAFLRTLIPGAEVKVIQGADHSTTLINPEFGSSIIAFLTSHRTSRN